MDMKHPTGLFACMCAAGVLFVAASVSAQTPVVAYPKPIPVTDTPAAAKDFILAGKDAKTAIIIGEQPKYRFPYWGGHTILQRYLMLITRDEQDQGGIVVPIVNAKDIQGKDINALYDYRIWVGDQPKIQEVLGADLKKIDDDGFIVRCTGRDLFICGKNIWGTHWAPYDLLERAAGCRWYMESGLRFWMPKEDGAIGIGDIIPRAGSVVIPGNANYTEEPTYKMRWFMTTPAHSFRERYRDRFHHALVGIMPPDKLGAQHPEYFPEIGGVRSVPPADHAYDFQPCISNPAVVDLVANAAKTYFKENPGDNSFSVGMNDSGKFCQCAKCNAMAPANITDQNARIAYSFFVFYNQVAAKVAAEYPDKRLGCLAYAILKSVPPGSIKLHPMIVPYLTVDSAQLWDPVVAKGFSENVDKWSKLAARMGIYEYIYGGGFIIPRLYQRYLIKNIQNQYGVGVDGFYGECDPNWGLDGPKYWLIDKMLWNNRYDPQKLLAGYYTDMFGPAGDEMKQYFDFLEETWCTQTIESKKSNYRWMGDIRQLSIFAPEKCDKAMDLIGAADKKVADLLAQEQDALKKRELQMMARRIAFFRTSFAFTRMMCYRYAACLDLEKVVAQKDMPFADALAGLETWQKSGSLRKNFEAVAALKFAINDISGHGANLGTFRYAFDNNPAPGKALYNLTQDLVGKAAAQGPVRDPDEMRKRIDAALAARLAEKPNLQAPNAARMVADLAKESGFLFVRRAVKPPILDGTINADEWGAPAYSGSFYEGFVIEDRVPYKTTVYAMADDANLYLAFACEADTKVMGADVTGRNTDAGAYPKMAKDDALAITLINAPNSAQSGVLVNLNGALRDGKDQPAEAKVHRTDTGWEAEVSIKRSAVTQWIAIARYFRYAAGDKKTETGFSTIVPVARFGNTVGSGNHEACMCFVWGSRLVLESPVSPVPAKQEP